MVRQRIQTILLREDGKTQPEIAELTGTSLSTVNRAHMAYDNGGVNTLRPRPKGGRRRENMTLDEERRFLDQFAKAAGDGELLNIRELKIAGSASVIMSWGLFADIIEGPTGRFLAKHLPYPVHEPTGASVVVE